MKSTEKIILFTRYPVPGNTKTRLIPDLGPLRAADIHRKLAETVFAKAERFAKKHRVEFEVSYTGGSLSEMKAWLGTSCKYSLQCNGDLGKRMYADFRNAFKSGSRRVVLIGTDVPEITLEHLEDAFCHLKDNDVTLGPSTDGGYWLIGMNRPCDIFSGMSWGCGTVLDQTLSLVKRNRLSVSLLSPLRDMDTLEDLSKWKPGHDWNKPCISVVIPVLNEEDKIEKAVKSAEADGIEVIAVDGGSSDDTVRIAESLDVKIIGCKRGRALQQNKGAQAAGGRHLLFLHADTVLPEGYSSIVFKTLMSRMPVLGAFGFKTDMKSAGMKLVELFANFRSVYLKLPYGDQCIFMKRADFFRAGLFPEVPIAEDIFFVRSIRKFAEVKISSVPAVTSARRWKRIGIFKTTLINIIVMLGCHVRMDLKKLSALYRNAG